MVMFKNRKKSNKPKKVEYKIEPNPDIKPFWDAVHWVQQQKIPSLRAWKKFAKEGKLPKDIPANPQYEYGKLKTGEWKGWRVWLGLNTESVIEAAQSKTQYLIVSNNREVPSNVWCFMSFSDTLENAIKLTGTMGNDVIRIYQSDPKYMKMVGDIILYMSTGTDMNSRLIPNPPALLFELDSYLEILVKN